LDNPNQPVRDTLTQTRTHNISVFSVLTGLQYAHEAASSATAAPAAAKADEGVDLSDLMAQLKGVQG